MNHEYSIGQRIRFARAELGLTQVALANMCEIAPTQFSRYESGRSTPRPETIVKIASALNVSPEWLSTGQGPIESNNPDAPPLDGHKDSVMQISLPADLAEDLKKEAESLGITVEMLILRALNFQMQAEKSTRQDSENARVREKELEEVAARAAEKALKKSQRHELHLQNQMLEKMFREMLAINPDYRPLANHPLFEDFYKRIDTQVEQPKSKTPSIPGVNAPRKGLGSSPKNKK